MHTLTKLRILSGALLVGGFAATQVLGASDLWLALCVTTGGVGFAGCLFAFALDHSDFARWSVVKQQTRNGTFQWVVGRLEADVWVERGRFSTKNAAQRYAFEAAQQEGRTMMSNARSNKP